MKNGLFAILFLWLLNTLFVSCAEPVKDEMNKPMLLIKIRDDSGKIIPGVPVKLYRNKADTGITQVVDSTGNVLFTELDPVLYYWLAEKGCSTNLASQFSLNRPLVPGAVHYGYSVLAPTGILKIINTSTDRYKVFDSVATFTVVKDTPYVAGRRVGSYLVHSEIVDSTGTGKDTLIRIRCRDTTVLVLPY